MGETTTEVSNDLVEMDNNGTVRKVYPEIAEFFAARKAAELAWKLYQVEYAKKVADVTYEKAKAAVESGGVYDQYEISREAERQFGEEYRAEDRKRSDFLNYSRRQNPRGNPNSWEILAQSSHKEVKWIVDNCMEYESEATTILKHLPATMDELWTIAKDDNSMCGVFDRFFEKAKAAGILKDEDMPASAREWSALSNYVTRTYGSGYMRDMRARIVPVIKAEVAYALEQARAEWQGQDEARAENVRRNRSEGAKRAAETRRRNREAVAVNGPHPDVVMENDAVVTPQPEEIPQPHAAAQAAAKVDPFETDADKSFDEMPSFA